LIDLSRNQGVTIFVSTHFMNEAERCDRISLMDSGRVLATDTPAQLVEARGASTLDLSQSALALPGHPGEICVSCAFSAWIFQVFSEFRAGFARAQGCLPPLS